MGDSGSGGLTRPRRTSITSFEEGETENQAGGLGSMNAGSTTDLGAIEDHSHSKTLADGVEISSPDVGYGCTRSRQQLASDEGYHTDKRDEGYHTDKRDEGCHSDKRNEGYHTDKRDEGYHSDRVPTLQQSKGDTIPAAGLEKDISAGESKASPLEPPVTKTTLSELDIPRIVYNPKLRHDVNFDPDLHFRPNLDGESGRRKTQKANDFWNRLRTEIEEFMADPVTFESKLAGKQWSLQSTLLAIGEILGTLVPPEDRSAVEEILNVELLMQQFRKGVADLEKLSIWLARTLKSHCAPMRDEWVDDMVNLLTVGDRGRNVATLVQGLQSLLGVLEAMKLDVANHQIRCLRPLLIQDTVEFEQIFFMKKISHSKVNIKGAYLWFQAAKSVSNNDQPETSSSQGDMWVFFKGFADLLLPSKMGTRIPDTFMFDEERIIKLRADISDAINLDICVRLLENISSKDSGLETQSTTALLASPRSPLRPRFSSGIHNSTMKSPNMPALAKFNRDIKVGHLLKVTRRPNRQTNLDESIRIVEPESEDDESDTESPPSTRRTSFSSTTSTSITSPLSRSVELPVAPVDSKLRRSILAIVDDASGNNRWLQSCSDIALELLRSTPSYDDLSRLESQLKLHLCNPTSSVFQRSESHVLAELYPLLFELTTRYSPLTATQLFEVATSPRPLPYQVLVPRHALSDIAKQMAHIGILHWRVWSPLAYLVDPDACHVTDATNPDSRTPNKAWGGVGENNRRPTPERKNSISESISTGS